MIYLNWKVEFHVDIDTSGIVLGEILVKLVKGNLYHPIYFASMKISQAGKKYMTAEREGLEMVYALLKFRHYLLGGDFKFFPDHLVLKYLVNKSVLEVRICRRLFPFQEFSFEFNVKPGKLNVGPNHLSQLELGESGRVIDDHIPDA
jgi:hypothetical protein